MQNEFVYAGFNAKCGGVIRNHRPDFGSCVILWSLFLSLVNCVINSFRGVGYVNLQRYTQTSFKDRFATGAL